MMKANQTAEIKGAVIDLPYVLSSALSRLMAEKISLYVGN